MENYQHLRIVEPGLGIVRDIGSGNRLACVTTHALTVDQVEMLHKRFVVFEENWSAGLVRAHAFIEQDGTAKIITEDFTALTPISQLMQNYRENNQFEKESELCSILKQLLLILERLHDAGVCHFNVSPENIYLDSDNNVKLGLFDVFQKRQQSIYSSPEFLINKQRSPKSDIFAIGCLLFEFSALKPPFLISEKVDSMMFGSVPDFPSFYSKDYCKLLKRMLQRDPKLRPSANALLSTPIMAQATVNEVAYCQGSPLNETKARTRVEVMDSTGLSFNELYDYLLANDDELMFRIQNVQKRLHELLGSERYEHLVSTVEAEMTSFQEISLPDFSDRDIATDIIGLMVALQKGVE